MSGSVVGSIGRLALTFGGYYFGGPIGGVVGSIAGGFLFPQKLPTAKGPRISDAPVTSSTQGIAIPIVHGTITVAGNIIWDGDFVEHKEKQNVGGKGAPKQSSISYNYTRSYAVGLCEGEIDGLLRAWRNGKLVYDIRPQQDGESDEDYTTRAAVAEGFAEGFTLYLGTETQGADPTIEGYEGVGEVPAHRGLAYIVFVDEDVTDNGARPSQWMFEVTRSADFSASEVDEYATTVVAPWQEGGRDPRSCQNEHRFRFVDVYGSGSASAWRDTLAEAQADGEAALGRSFTTLIGWRPLVSGASQLVHPHETSVTAINGSDPLQSAVLLGMHYTDETPATYRVYATDSSGNSCGSLGLELNGDTIWWNGFRLNGVFDENPAVWRKIPFSDPTPSGWGVNNNCDGLTTKTIRKFDMIIQVQRLTRAPANPCEPYCTDPYPLLPENLNYCVIGTSITRSQDWSLTAGTYKALQEYSAGANWVETVPLTPVLPLGDANYSSQAFWEAAYNAAVDSGDMAAGLTYGVDYPVVLASAYTRAFDNTVGTPEGVTLGSIVADYCERASLSASEYNVSELTELVKGTKIESVMTARDAIEPLRSYGFFDCIDSGSFLSFPVRGKGSVATLGADDLGAAVGESEGQPLVEVTRAEDVELPRMVRVSYLQPERDYAVGQQKSTRLITTTVGADDIELVVSMTDDKAAQIADVILAERWVGRESYQFKASPRWLALEPGDVVTIPVEGEQQNARITSINHGQLLEVEASRDESTAYQSSATGAPATSTPPGIGFKGPTFATYIDGAALNEAGNEAGVYVAAYGVGDEWRGATIYQSLDGGANYTSVGTVNVAATMGTLVTALLATSNCFIFDRTSTVRVTLVNGTLESFSEEAVLNGANAAFVGAEGRWELFQFTTATLVSTGVYDLSGFLRGRKGTEWAMETSEVGDSFVLASTTVRIPLDSAAVGIARDMKAVTFGTLLESATAVDLTPAGVALEPYAPSHVERLNDGSSDITIQWYRRTRLSGEWQNGVDVPLNEESESYEVDVLDGDTVVRTISTATESVTYTAAQQVSDFGSAQATVTVIVYQLSAKVGRGYGTEATV